MILRIAAKVAIVSRCAPGIDARGLHKTNLAALRDALVAGGLRRVHLPERRLPGRATGHEQRAVIGGDAKSAAIAAASVIAKETRDRYMRRADAAHPGLGVRPARRLLHARAPRGDRAPRRLAAAPALVPVDGLSAAGARRLERALQVLEAHQAAGGVDGDSRSRRSAASSA